MPEPLPTALAQVRKALLDVDTLVRAVGSGRRRGHQPDPQRVEMRPVDLKTGRHLQVVSHSGSQATTRNLAVGEAGAAVDELLELPFGNWHVETVDETVQLRVTKRGEAQVHRAATSRRQVVPRGHDRVKPRLIDPDDPLFSVLGADADKRRQVDAFLRLLDPVVRKAFSDDRPLRVVDLGCGNAYLTFAAHRYLAERRPGTRTVGVELRPELVERSTQRAREAALEGLSFVPGTIAEASVGTMDGDGTGSDGVDVVLALHACDTATDEALARAVKWQAPVVLAAPCCHHDVQRQLAEQQGAPGPFPYQALTRHPILRERFADVLTDSLRAAVLRLNGYRVDVVEFVDSRHTPRNAMIRATRTGAPPTEQQREEYESLVEQWQVEPALARML
ncbi:MAG TPA: SAM-dependent methyltransferase [Actinomycetales bacterium]|nr:SAM-dependent methyltransferase [Actinomycetales bacterium]